MLERARRLIGLGRKSGLINLPTDDDAPRPIEGENLLLISDLHLGEACKDHSRIEYLKKGAELDADLCAFLEHFTQNRPHGRPWRLILGGDLIDFLQVTMTPPEADAEQQKYGLGTREEESAWKLRRVMERHRRVFVFLAGFVGAGNRIELIQGNHDEELFWPACREILVQGLVHLYFGDEAASGEGPEAFAARIHYNGWFYYQAGLLYVEHGHRFDPFCATPPQLCPLLPQAEEELVQPLSGLAIRYFANLERGFRTHDKEHWGLPEYYGYYASRGWDHVADVVRRYISLIARVFSYHAEHGRFRSEQADGEHEERLHALAQRSALTLEDVRTVDGMGARPVTSSLLGIYTIMGLAEWTAIFGSIALALLLLLIGWPWFVEVPLLAGGIAGAVSWRLWCRNRYHTDIRARLDQGATSLSTLLDVPVVAMGHSHRAARRRMAHDHRAFYVNTGCFLPDHHEAHPPGAPCRCPSSFVEIVRSDEHDRVIPELKRWCRVKRGPEKW